MHEMKPYPCEHLPDCLKVWKGMAVKTETYPCDLLGKCIFQYERSRSMKCTDTMRSKETEFRKIELIGLAKCPSKDEFESIDRRVKEKED